MQTLKRSNTGAPESGPPPPNPLVRVALLVAAVAAVPVVLLAVLTQWGVIVVIVLALMVALALWIWQRELLFIQVVAFLIHFDGVGVGPVRMGRILAAIAAVLIVYKLLAGWRPPALPTRYWAFVAALGIWAVFSGAWSESSSSWIFALGQYSLALIYFGITGLLVDSHQKIQQFLRAYWIGGLFGSAGGIAGLILGVRSVGFGGDPNFFGLLQASLIPLTVYYRRQATTTTQRVMYTLALFVVLAGAAGAGSRSGLIGGALAIVGTMVTRPGLAPLRRARVGVGAVVMGAVAAAVGFVANPTNLQRGFGDRGAGRLDVWTVARELIWDAPIVGHGFGQLRTLIPANLLTTPGSQHLIDKRTELSAHNTWFELAGDLGAVGVILFVTVLVVALAGFARPRWLQTRELSATLMVMMLPVLSGSMFLPLLNNKLAWALIGLSAALQVPSWGARWTGLPGTLDGPPTLPEPVGRDEPPDPAAGGETRWNANLDERWEEVRLARWDLRVSRRFRILVVLGALLGAIALGAVASVLPTSYSATAGLFVPRLDDSENARAIAVDRTRMQGVLTMVISTAYAGRLKELAGLDLSIPEIQERMAVTRPGLGAHVQLEYSDTDRDNTLAVMPHLVTALDEVFLRGQTELGEQVANEVRPLVPGEQRFYSGDFYLRAYRDSVFAVHPPRSGWRVFVGTATGALVAAVVMLLQQRRPRVNNGDDLLAVTGLPVWAHVGRHGRRYGATRAQYAQVLSAARDRAPADAEPTRIVVASPRPDRGVRGLAVGIAAALAAEGRQVVLVDAQLDRPALSLHMGAFGRPGLAEVGAGRAALSDVLRRVHRWRLPSAARRALRRSPGELRFVPAGRMRRSPDRLVPLEAFDGLDPEVYVVLLAPSTLGDVANAPVLGWGDVVVLGLVEGRTITFDAEDAASRVRSFGAGPGGVVLLDV